MLKLDALQAFAAIAEAQSFTGAAQRLAMSKSVISERLAELERTLGVKLVHRTTRKLSLTEEGMTFHERAKNILRDVESAAAEVTSRRGSVVGPLRISAPVGFGSLHLGTALFSFLKENPNVELTLELDDRFVNLLAEGYDAVIRHGPVADKRIIVKRIAASRRVLVASPDYIKRMNKPTSLQDLEQHAAILYSNRGAADWRFRQGRKFVTLRPGAVLRVNNGILMRDAAVAGLGIALLPTFFLEDAIRKRALKTIDINAEAEGATIFIAYPEHLRSSAKILALTASLQRTFHGAFAITQPPE